jgi:tRNA(Ile2) C34 agmatinyltransferase TiaS
VKCPDCGRHMSSWSLPEPGCEPAWHCANCDITISDEEADARQEGENDES